MSAGNPPLEIEDLPESLLLEVFQFLYHKTLCLGARMVCRRWRAVSHDGELWRCVTIPVHFTDQRLRLFLSNIHEELEELDCSTCESLSEDGFSQIAELTFPRLRLLEMPIMNTYSDLVYHKLASSCPNLERLENVCSNENDTCSPVQCQGLFPKLKVLFDKPLSNYGRIRPSNQRDQREKHAKWLNELKDISKLCPNIETYRCRRAQNYLNDETAPLVSTIFPNLTAVDFYYCSLTDRGVAEFLAVQKGHLDTVALDNPGKITDKGVKMVVQTCTRLNSLKVSRCSGVSDDGAKYIGQYSERLQELHLHNMQITLSDDGNSDQKDGRLHFTDEAVATIGAGCPTLFNFRIFYTNALTNKGIESLADSCRLLQGLMLYDCSSIDDNSMNALVGLKFLKALVLVNCEGVTPPGIINLVLRAPYLYRLTLFNKGDSFRGDMEELAKDTYEKLETSPDIRPNVMKKLTLKGVNGSFVQLLTVLCPKLHTLDLREWNLVGSLSLKTVLMNCEKLTTLDVPFLTGLDDDFLSAVVEYGRALKKLGLGSAVCNMSTKALTEVLAKCPSLTSVTMDTKGSAINEDLLLAAARIHHGNRCFFHMDPDTKDLRNHRFIELHFTPIIYLDSVIPADEPFTLQ